MITFSLCFFVFFFLLGFWIVGHIPDDWENVWNMKKWLKKDRHHIPWFWEK